MAVKMYRERQLSEERTVKVCRMGLAGVTRNRDSGAIGLQFW